MARSASIGRRLRWLSIVSSGTAVIAVSLALLFFQLQAVRENLLRRLETVSDLIAFNSAAAVDFGDADAANTLLGSLKTRPEIVTAAIIVKGRVFAMYHQGNASAPRPDDFSQTVNGFRFTDKDVTVFRTIISEQRPLGTLFIRSDLRQISETWRWFAAITAVVAIPALLIAALISQLPQRAISRPILGLASLAAAVSQRKDYSVRASAVHGPAEIEQLIDTFNQMLTEIQQQHREIEEARTTLEERVADRTRELELRTEQLEVQGRELAAANSELESFSYSVSHDLRAPLRAIDGFSQAIISGGYSSRPLDQKGLHFLERVRAGTQKMSALIDDMLVLARVTRRPLERRDVDMTAIAAEVSSDLARRNPDRHVDCRIEPGLRALADSHLLAIVFENLLGNAWKFTGKRDGAHIEVGQQPDSTGPVFFVRDNGAGFDMAYAGKLFGPFQRLHDDSSFEGTGIGLATVKRIVTRHHGRVWAEAVEDEGAAFFFTLGGRS